MPNPHYDSPAQPQYDVIWPLSRDGGEENIHESYKGRKSYTPIIATDLLRFCALIGNYTYDLHPDNLIYLANTISIVTGVSQFEENIDLFINDSDHSAEYEYREYQTIKDKITSTTIILGDNAHVTNKLAIFSNENNRDFLFFKEVPSNHWYLGAGIGISFDRYAWRRTYSGAVMQTVITETITK